MKHEIIHPVYGLLKRIDVDAKLSAAESAELLNKTCDEMFYPRPGVKPAHIIKGPGADAHTKHVPVISKEKKKKTPVVAKAGADEFKIVGKTEETPNATGGPLPPIEEGSGVRESQPQAENAETKPQTQ
jgi:hypothetical protein